MKEAYLRSVRVLLDCPAEERERLLARLDRAVTAYLEDIPEADRADLTANFGTPEDCAARLLGECSPTGILVHQRRGDRRSRILISILAVFLIGITCVTGYFLTHRSIIVLTGGPWITEDWTPIKNNSKGETFGTVVQAQTQGEDLDFIAVIGTEGQEGYIRESDTVWGKWKYSIRSPEDSQKYMEELHSHPAKELIPLYDSEGNVIGEYLYTNWSEREFPDEDLAAAMERRREGSGQ